MLLNYSYHIWFKVCRPLRRKYKLSTNCLLVLNGVYCHYIAVNKPLTRKQLIGFLSYYNNRSINIYISVLVGKGYIEEYLKKSSIKYYRITLAGIQVINDLNDSYQIELSKFCQTYNISL